MKLETFQLAELDLQRKVLIKAREKWYGDQDHSRWVYRDRRRLLGRADFFYKVWNATYVRRDNLVRALDGGFYTEELVPALTGLVVQDGVCRGYVMRRCRRHGRMVDALRGTIEERTRSTRLFSCQFGAVHIMRFEQRFSLVDLEAVYRLDEYAGLGRLHAAFDDREYEQFVRTLIP